MSLPDLKPHFPMKANGVSFLNIEMEKTLLSLIRSCVRFFLEIVTDTCGGEEVT
jgi:hypothetical protein